MASTEMLTPSGYRVELRDFFSIAGRRAVQKVMAKYFPDLGPDTDPSDFRIPLIAKYEAEEESLRQMVLSVVLPDGSTAPDPVVAVGDMPETDGALVYDKINELTEERVPRTREEIDAEKNDSTASLTSSPE